MKYPPAPLTPSLATLPQNVRLGFSCPSLVSITSTVLSVCASIACALLNSLASLFATPVLYFQSFVDSFVKTPGGGGAAPISRHSFTPNALPRGAAPLLLAFVFKNLQIPLRACPPTPLFIFSHLQIAWRANSFVSHRYKLPGCHPLK